MRTVNTIKDGLPILDPSRSDLPEYICDATYEMRIFEAGELHSVCRPWMSGCQSLGFVDSYNRLEQVTGRKAEAHLIPESLPQGELCETA